MQPCGKSLLLFHKLKSRHPERNASPSRTRGILLRARNTGRWPVRPADILSAVSDSTEGCTVASSSAEYNSDGRTDCKSVFQSPLGGTVLSFWVHREMFVLQMIRDALRLLGCNLFRGCGSRFVSSAAFLCPTHICSDMGQWTAGISVFDV